MPRSLDNSLIYRIEDLAEGWKIACRPFVGLSEMSPAVQTNPSLAVWTGTVMVIVIAVLVRVLLAGIWTISKNSCTIPDGRAGLLNDSSSRVDGQR
jgi:hypothetical protein